MNEQESKEEVFHQMYNLALKVPGLVPGLVAAFTVVALDPEKFAAEMAKQSTREDAAAMFEFAGTVMEWWSANDYMARRLYVQHGKILGLHDKWY